MFRILMVIVSIALFATVTLVTINYIPIDALIAFKARSKEQEGLQSLAAGSVRYIKSVTDVNGITTLPAPGTDLSATLQPTFAFIPVAPSGMSWKVESSTYSGMPAVAICLFPSGAIDDATQRGGSSTSWSPHLTWRRRDGKPGAKGVFSKSSLFPGWFSVVACLSRTGRCSFSDSPAWLLRA